MKASKWKQEYLTKIDESNALFNLLPLHMNPQVEWIQNLSAICRVCDNNTQAALNKLNLVYPEINNDLLNKYISFLRETKFI